MLTLPDFTPEGVLPPGDYAMTLDELEESILVLGPGPPKDHLVWDAAWRHQLVANLRVMVEQLWKVGITEVFIDGYFVCDEQRVGARSLHRDLNTIDPAKCWTWDHKTRRAYRGYPKLQLPMWHAYRVELYPHWPGLVPPAPSQRPGQGHHHDHQAIGSRSEP